MRQLHRTLLLASSLLITWSATAQELPFQVFNFLKVEYDDNVFTTGKGAGTEPQESFKIVEQIEFLLDSQQGNTYYGVRYSPSLVWFEDRPGDSSDVNHQFDLILNQDFSPRTSLNLKHVLRAAQEPELVSEDVTFRNNNDYLYNSFDAKLLTQVVPNKTSAQVSGRFVDFSYDDDEVAETNDYQEMTAGLDLIQVVMPETTVSGQLRYSEVDYEADLRDFDNIQIGLAASRIFNPKFEAQIRGGVEMHSSDDPIADDLETPYISGSLVFLPAMGTRITLGAGYAQDKSPVVIFSTQEKTTLSATLSRDLTAALGLHLTGIYSIGSFTEDNATQAFDPDVNSDGDETILRFVSTLSYRVNVRNSVEATLQYTDLESDVRPQSDYDRTRVSLGWKYSL
ncbi:MAG: outer membrane beta-barrel protein [Kiritimatiellae bacterium]|jgi:hypothetical protein|nr:outer membrane beta-barrel protein [Kiritimatiellia bacterium]